MFTDSRIRWIGLSVSLLIGCGGGNDNGNDPPDPVPVVTVTPGRDTLTVGTTVQLAATVTGTGNTAVTWTAVSGGSVSATGLYTAGAAAGTALVIATSAANAAGKDTATIMVVAAPSGTLTVPDSAVRGDNTLVGSVTPATGVTYTWAIAGGTLTTGQGTQQVSVTAGGGATLGWSLTIRNLADSAVTLGGQTTLVEGPEIVSFVATRATVTIGEGTGLLGVFTGGTGAIEGIGPVTSGVSAPVGPLVTPYVPSTFILIVTGVRGAFKFRTAAVIAVLPPVLNRLEVVTRRVPVGNRGQFLLGWNNDPGVVASILPDVGVVTTGFPVTPVISAPGAIRYTFSVRTPADSILTDTVTITAVPPAPGAFRVLINLRDKFQHTATRLADGRVLIAGGRILDQPLIHGQVQIYNPVTEQFTDTDSLLHSRRGHVATLLQDGRVLVAGGNASDPIDSEYYDPVTGHWTQGPVLPGSPIGAVQMPDGRVLLIMRSGPSQLLDPTNNSLTATGTAAGPILESAVVDLGGGRVMLAATPTAVSTQIYDISTGLFTTSGAMNAGHGRGIFVALPDGKVLAAGGMDDQLNWSSAGETFDPATGVWTPAGDLSIARSAPAGVLLQNGRVLMAGGLDRAGQLAAFAEIFDPVTRQFTPTLNNQVATTWAGLLTALTNGKALSTGGLRPGETNGVVELFEP